MALRTDNVSIRDWSQFASRTTAKSLDGKWYFRGALEGWPLETSLERAFRDWDLPLNKMPETERRLLREFKRALSLTPDTSPPHPDDTLGWLALMQHHGAPTRLLDWTYSPFVAAYFAMEALLCHRDAHQAVVWALSGDPFDDPARFMKTRGLLTKMEHFRRYRDGPSFEAVFFRDRHPLRFVYPVNPARLNQRLIIQQGLFLCPADVSTSFEDNLHATGRAVRKLRLLKFVFERALLQEGMYALQRMNMQPASLFPGLDGYARNFRPRLHFISEGNLFRETTI